MNTNTDPLIELRADGHLAVLTFGVGETSKLTRKFIGELSTALTAGQRKPLICANDRQLVAIFKSTMAHVELRNENGRAFRCGKKFADAKASRDNLTKFTTDDAAIPQGGTWADKRSPATVYRHELPVMDPEVVTRALTDLVDSWETAGDLGDLQTLDEARAEYLARQPKVPTEEEQVAAMAQTPIADLDPMNPVRFIPGFLAKVRAYRQAHGLDAGQIKDPRVNRARP